ncbi:hypothetical protein HAX54_009186 [Datura stramonium]|uniref:Secreted protein n=1 Tax=Datura stramonium TaxID=4076 RepID=A0ABS8TG84_DATST|nr:hypothetical protein [Datura stramonium]
MVCIVLCGWCSMEISWIVTGLLPIMRIDLALAWHKNPFIERHAQCDMAFVATSAWRGMEPTCKLTACPTTIFPSQLHAFSLKFIPSFLLALETS